MCPEDTLANLEREKTDESLRVEREKTDFAIGEKLSAVEETADALINLARARADALLQASRSKTDRQSATGAPSRTHARLRATAKERDAPASSLVYRPAKRPQQHFAAPDSLVRRFLGTPSSNL